jgi:integration host factor subunit beta
MTTDGENLAGMANARRAQTRALTRTDLIAQVAQTISITEREAKEIVELIFGSIVRALDHDEKVEIRGFGSFRCRQRGARRAHNPKTGAPVSVPAKKIPYFKPSRELMDRVQTKNRCSDVQKIG